MSEQENTIQQILDQDQFSDISLIADNYKKKNQSSKGIDEDKDLKTATQQ